jgi:hypothetical protein
MNKENRYRLSKKEIEIIEQLRKTGTVPDSTQILSDINKNNINSKHSDLKRKYSQCLTELDHANARIKTLIDINKDTIKPYKISPSNNINESESTMCILASDWHFEETVDPLTVNGLNEFNLDIARTRANNFFKKSHLMYKLLAKSFNIENLVLALLGDFINGYIHEEFVEDNNLSPTQSIREVKKVLISGINFLLNNCAFKQIIIPCSYGNHGRTTPKSRIATAYKNSYEWLMYKDLEDHFENEKRVKFVVSNSYHCFVELYDKYRIRFHHGDSISYSGGIGGIATPVAKAINNWNKSIPSYLDCFGHFHSSCEGNNFIANGSLIGFNSFATFIKASFEQPQQSMFVINEQYGKILSAPIFVGDK